MIDVHMPEIAVGILIVGTCVAGIAAVGDDRGSRFTTQPAIVIVPAPAARTPAVPSSTAAAPILPRQVAPTRLVAAPQPPAVLPPSLAPEIQGHAAVDPPEPPELDAPIERSSPPPAGVILFGGKPFVIAY